jgi:hypothetical protein
VTHLLAWCTILTVEFNTLLTTTNLLNYFWDACAVPMVGVPRAWLESLNVTSRFMHRLAAGRHPTR